MMDRLPRRALLLGSAASAALALRPECASAEGEIKRSGGPKIKLALNAYSFNKPLTSGAMNLEEVIDYCALHNVDGVDLTGYYFPGYPKVPSDEYIYKLKRKAYLNGVTINGTGVRNDFATADAASRRAHLELIRNWTDAANKMGAGFIRVFSGPAAPTGYSFDQVLEWMVPAFKECAEYGRQHGVIIALQHHDDFLKTADQTIRIVKAVNSPWFSVVLDVGSLRQGDPYAEIEKLLPYACTWQIKENVWYGQKAEPIDLAKIRAIIDRSGYRGFVPIEALGQGKPEEVVTRFLDKVRAAMA